MARRTEPGLERLLTIAQAAELIGTTERFPRRLIAERRIRFVRVGRHVRIPESAVAELIAAGLVEPCLPGRLGKVHQLLRRSRRGRRCSASRGRRWAGIAGAGLHPVQPYWPVDRAAAATAGSRRCPSHGVDAERSALRAGTMRSASAFRDGRRAPALNTAGR
jgi:excisionase family DNA binding protein